MADLDAAIAAAEQPAREERAPFQVTLPTGRVVLMNVPADLNASEAVALIGWIAAKLPAELAKAQAPRPRILVPQSSLRS